jgi:Uma2 family endonuclease
MGTKMLIPVEEYLRTSYDPDCDYVDGEILERNVGEKDHSSFQGELLVWFRLRRDSLGTRAFVEQRVRVSGNRYRIPDVCVYIGKAPEEQVFEHPPFICVEVLSPEDRFARIRHRLEDYARFGVPNIWVVDPFDRSAWNYRNGDLQEIRDGILRTQDPVIEVPLQDIFASMDE